MEVGRRVVRIETQNLAVIGNGLGVQTPIVLGIAAVEVGRRVVGVEAQGLVVIGNGLDVLAQFALGRAAIEVSLGIVRIQTQNLVVIGNGLDVLAQFALGRAAIEVSQRVVGVEAQGLVVAGNGFPVPFPFRLAKNFAHLRAGLRGRIAFWKFCARDGSGAIVRCRIRCVQSRATEQTRERGQSNCDAEARERLDPTAACLKG